MARGNRVITEELAMRPLATSWSELRAWSATHGAELRLCVRSTTAAVLTLAVAQLLNLPIALWAVLTAVILTQISVGRSLKATIDYLTSTLGGAVYAGAIGALVPHDNQFAVFAGLAIALAPAVLLAALYPRFSAAPFTAVMVFFAPTITHTGPIAAAFERVIEVAVGCVVGLVVSLVVLPARAHDLAIEAATEMLALMARFVPELFARLTPSPDRPALSDMQTRIGEALGGWTRSPPRPGTSGSRGSAPSPTMGRCCARCYGCTTISSSSDEPPSRRCPRYSGRGLHHT